MGQLDSSSLPSPWLALLTPLLAPFATQAGRASSARRTAPGPLPAPAAPTRAAAVPLRVCRLLETGQGPEHAGRMVISGRLADVCAELDRLAAVTCG